MGVKMSGAKEFDARLAAIGPKGCWAARRANRPEGRFFCDYLCGAIVLPAALSFSALSEKIGEKRSGELRLAHAAGTGSGKSCFSVVIKAQVSPPDAKVHTACRLPPSVCFALTTPRI